MTPEEYGQRNKQDSDLAEARAKDYFKNEEMAFARAPYQIGFRFGLDHARQEMIGEFKALEFRLENARKLEVENVELREEIERMKKLDFCPAAEPVRRSWSKPEDVPLNCWLSLIPGFAVMVVGVDDSGIFTAREQITWQKLHELQWQHSTDRINWKPCVVEEPRSE